MAYTSTQEAAKEWLRELSEVFPGAEIYAAPLSLSIACHIGPGSLAVAVTKKLEM